MLTARCRLRIDAISPNRRLCYAVEVIESLCSLIRTRQQFDPIEVLFDGETFRILDGEKRFRACKVLGMTHIEAVIVGQYGEP
jgi:ParB-like chromosome segregation protein Spo0J